MDAGETLKDRILSFLASWPQSPERGALGWGATDPSHKEAARNLALDARRWFNTVNLTIAPLILHDRDFLYYTLRQVEAAIRKHEYERPRPQSGVVQLQGADPRTGLSGLLGGRRADIDYEASLARDMDLAAEG